jgi:hypothetical protein
MCAEREYIGLIQQLLKSKGAELSWWRGGKHLRAFAALNGYGRTFTIPSSPSDVRTIRNFKASVKRFVREASTT